MKTKEKKLNRQETFILLASAYLHDIGMQYGKLPKLGLMEIRDKHHIFSEEMILGSVEKPSEYRNLGVPQEYADEIAKVSKGHRKTDLNGDEFNKEYKGGEWIRLRLLAALLSLADEIDLSYKRVIIENLKLEQVPQESRVHWWRCYYVEGVSVESGRICIHFKFPSRDYRGLIVPSLQDQIDQRLSELRDILWDSGVRLFIGEHKVEYSRTKTPMSNEDLDFLKEERARKEMLRSTRTEREISDLIAKARVVAGLNARYRRYAMNLDYYKYNPEVLEGTISYVAIVRNETDKVKELFPGGKVCNGHTTIPDPLKANKPDDPKVIFNFEKLLIDGKAEQVEKKIKYKGDKEIVRRDIFCTKLVPPETTHEIKYKEKALLEKSDNLTRRFFNISFGIVEVHVHHPSTILPKIFWYSRKESDLRTSELRVSPTFITYMAEGRWDNGSGFLLSWKEKK